MHIKKILLTFFAPKIKQVYFFSRKELKYYFPLNNKWKYPGSDLNRHAQIGRGILSPLCLPISPPGHKSPASSSNAKIGGVDRIRTGE